MAEMNSTYTGVTATPKGKSTFDIVTWCILAAIEEHAGAYHTEIRSRYPDLALDKVVRSSVRAAALYWMRKNYDRKGAYNKMMFYACYNELFGGMFKAIESLESFYKRLLYPLLQGGDVVTLAIDRRWVDKTQPRRSPYQVAVLKAQYRKSARPCEAYKALCAACAQAGEQPMSEGNLRIIYREFKEQKAKQGDSPKR